MPRRNRGKTVSDTKLLDAEEFKEALIARTQDKGDEEGKKIAKYLDEVVPDWKGMRATRLYKHVQDMLKNAEENKRFEMEIAGKRAIYFMPFMLIFFTAFGYLGFIAYENVIRPIAIDWFDDEGSEYFSNKGDFILIFILALIANANAGLSLVMVTISGYSHTWQKNWKHHVDYLQTSLGIKLMRACLGINIKNVVIDITSMVLGYFMFRFWIVVVILLSTLLAVLPFVSKCQEFLLFGFCGVIDMLVFIGATFHVILFTFITITACSKISLILKKNRAFGEEKMSISPLPKLFY